MSAAKQGLALPEGRERDSSRRRGAVVRFRRHMTQEQAESALASIAEHLEGPTAVQRFDSR